MILNIIFFCIIVILVIALYYKYKGLCNSIRQFTKFSDDDWNKLRDKYNKSNDIDKKLICNAIKNKNYEICETVGVLTDLNEQEWKNIRTEYDNADDIQKKEICLRFKK
jgi:hypothetical protein